MEIDLEIVGSNAILHSSSDSPEPSSYLQCRRSKNVWIDGHDARMLLGSEDNLQRSKELDQAAIDEDNELYVDLTYERYRDLFPDTKDKKEEDTAAQTTNQSTYKSNREEIWVRPMQESYITTYDIPEHLTRPQSKKQADVILMTIKNIRQHGAQLEILLKVKHADDHILFDFLNHQNDLHAFYKWAKALPEKDFWELLLGKANSPAIDTTASVANVSSALNLLVAYGAEDEEEEEEEHLEAASASSVTASLVDACNPPLSPHNSQIDPLNAVVDASSTTVQLVEEADSSSRENVASHLDDGLETEDKVAPPAEEPSVPDTFTCLDHLLDDDPLEDDLLDDDVDETEFWGKSHKDKKERIEKQIQEAASRKKAERLHRAKELKSYFKIDVSKDDGSSGPFTQLLSRLSSRKRNSERRDRSPEGERKRTRRKRNDSLERDSSRDEVERKPTHRPPLVSVEVSEEIKTFVSFHDKVVKALHILLKDEPFKMPDYL